MKPTISNKLFFAQANKVFLGLCLFNLDTASVKVLAIKNSPKSFRISLNVEFTGLFDLDSKKQKISESQEWFCTYNSKKSSFQIESIKSLNPIYTSKILQISDVEKLQNDLQSCLIQMLWKDSSPIQKVQALKKWKNLGGPDSLLVFKSNQAMEKVHLTTWSNNTFLTNVVNSVFINGIDIEQIDVPSINKDGSFISKVTIWKGLFFNKDSPKWYENKQEIYRTVTQKQQSILEIKAVSIKF